MSSSDNQISNTIILTLYESEICEKNKNNLPYSLIINYNNNTTQETNIIKTFKHKFNSTKFIFNTSKSSIRNIHQITISAYTKTMFIIKNTFGKVTIRFNISKIEKKKTQWYFLKDNCDEIIMKILLSISSDCALHQYNSMSSLERINNNNILNSSQSLNNLSQNINYFNSKLFINRSMANLNSTSIIHHLKVNSNQLISILENENEKNGNICDNSIISNSTFVNSNNTFFYPNSNLLEILDEKYNVNIDLIQNKIYKKKENLCEIEKKIEENQFFLSSHERIFKKKKNVLEKEKNKLKENMKNLQKMKTIYENNNITLYEKTRIFERQILRDELIEDINNNNHIFFNQINFLFLMNDNLEMLINLKEKNNKEKKNKQFTPIKTNIINNINNNIKSKTNSNKKNVIKLNNNNSSLFNLNKRKNLKLNYSLKFLNSSKINSYCFNESESNLKRNHSSKIKFANKKNLKTLFNKIQSPKKNEVKKLNNNNNIKTPNRKNKIIKEQKNKIVEFDNIKVITIKPSSSKLNIHSKQIKKKTTQSNLNKKKKNNNIEKKPINKVLSQNHSNIINKININNNNISKYINQNSNSINKCVINLQ